MAGSETEQEGRGNRRPDDVAIKQQRLKSWQPILDPKWVIASYIAVAVVFIPTGLVLVRKSDELVEIKKIYESHAKGIAADVAGCEIGNRANEMYLSNRTCQVSMTTPREMQPPILLHYELSNFYQNYRRYYTSRDANELLGLPQDLLGETACQPLNKINGVKINPCGLIANTLFNDVIALQAATGPDGQALDLHLDETGIAWRSDLEWKFRQPADFFAQSCGPCFDQAGLPTGSCDCCDCFEIANNKRKWSCDQPYQDQDGLCHLYYYPDDETTQYLHETYPMIISPLEGVTNEHFVVWMRVAALPQFRKLYGHIASPIPANTTLLFSIQANFAVERLQAAKALVLSENYIFGGKNPYLGLLFVVVGAIAGILGVAFGVKDLFYPRKIGDTKYLRYKLE